MPLLNSNSGVHQIGPLAGVKVVELAGIGPGPFAGMLLADLGAEVVCIERSQGTEKPKNCANRGKYSVALNLKDSGDVEVFFGLIEKADIFFEGFRPGVCERLGIGPDECLARNPRLIYGRITGWGQHGPLAQCAGHDINYIALTGALAAIGRKDDRPVPPVNLLGDFAGGSMFMIMGILAALYEVQKTGKGQVIDAAMTEGASVLSSFLHTMDAKGRWTTSRGCNELDGGAHYYNTYETRDQKYIALGAIEPQFYAQLCELMELPSEFSAQKDVSQWPLLEQRMIDIVRQKTRAEWCELLEGTDACFAPVLDYMEAMDHPHNVSRNSFIDVEGHRQPAPAPRFSRTHCEVQHAAPIKGANTEDVLRRWGVSAGSGDGT